jgi:hypothetical protein
VENHAKRKARYCLNDPRGLQLSSHLKTYLFEIPLCRKNQRGQGGKRLEGPQIRIGSIPKGRVWKLICNKREEKSVGEIRRQSG